MTVLTVNQDQVVLHFVGTDSVTVLGNNTVSNVTSSTAEIVNRGSIYQVWYGSDAGSWQLVSGNSNANAVIAVFSGTGYVPYGGMGEELPMLSNGEELYATLDGSANGYIMIDLRKESSF